MNGYGNLEMRAKNNNRGIDTQWIKENETRINQNNSIFLKATPQQDNFEWTRDTVVQKQEAMNNEWVRKVPQTKQEEKFEWTRDPEIEQRAEQMVEAMARGEIDTNGQPIMGQQNSVGYYYTKNMGFVKLGILGILSIVVTIGIIVLGVIFR